MVTRRTTSYIAALCAASLIPAGSRADGVLEQMQREVAGIIRSTKGAVVTIEDDRASAMGSLNVGYIAAKAMGEAQLANGTKALSEMRQKIRASGTDQAEMQKEMAEVHRAMRDAQRKVQQELRRSTPSIYFGAPKSGSGFCIGDGYVVTTADVLEGMKTPVVVTDNGTRIKATVVGTDTDLNVGLLRIPEKADGHSLAWGDSSATQPGFFAISIGNQSGQLNSAALNLVAGIRTDGFFSGNHFYPNLLQIAGTVGAGTSGAPLLDASGKVIGMMAAVPTGDWSEFRTLPRGPASPRGSTGNATPMVPQMDMPGFQIWSGPPAEAPVPDNPAAPGGAPQAAGMAFFRPSVSSAGYAIPVNDIRPVVEGLKSGKHMVRAWIGVATNDQMRYVSDGDVSHAERLVRVETVFQDSPAARGGVQPGDILITLAGYPVTTTGVVRAVSWKARPGDKIDAVIKRGNETRTLVLRIEARPAEIRQPLPPNPPGHQP